MSAVTFNMKGGRSSVSGIKATVFGASGFLGPYVVNRLGKIGSSITIPYRGDEIYLRKLKPMADLGQINMYPMSIRNVDEIEQAVAGSNVVINMLGIHLETRRARRLPAARPPPARRPPAAAPFAVASPSPRAGALPPSCTAASPPPLPSGVC